MANATDRITPWHQHAIAFLQANRQKFKLKLDEPAEIYDSFGHVSWQLTDNGRVHTFNMYLYNSTLNLDGNGATQVDHNLWASLRNCTKFTPTADAMVVDSIQNFEQYIVERAVKLEAKQAKRLNLQAKRGMRDDVARVEDTTTFSKMYGVSKERVDAAFALADKHLPKGMPKARKELADAILMFAS